MKIARVLCRTGNRCQSVEKRWLRILRTIDEVRSARRQSLLEGHSMGFVPTMGALHSGHIKLMERAKMETDIAVTSIFVNPTQFSVGEDLDKYPRPLEEDIDKLEKADVDILFLPDHDSMYPGSSLCHIEPEAFSHISEGKARPDFFRGVATICCKLFNIVQPDLAYFGQKDISQCILMRNLIKDLNIPTFIAICETIREHDGLALSSRNVYLTPEERKKAKILFKALTAGKSFCESSGGSNSSDASSRDNLTHSKIVEKVHGVLASEPLVTEVEYVSVASHVDMKEIDVYDDSRGAVISSAIKVGNVRLIDNVLVGRDASNLISPQQLHYSNFRDL